MRPILTFLAVTIFLYEPCTGLVERRLRKNLIAFCTAVCEKIMLKLT